MKFTDRQVLNLKPRAERYEVWETRGLGLRISPAGVKSWVFMYRFKGKLRRATLGKYPTVSVGRAHTLHSLALEQIEKGVDPGKVQVQARRTELNAPTVSDLAEQFVEKHSKAKKRSWKVDEKTLEREILPTWGRRKAKDIRRRDVIELFDSMVRRGTPIAANRAFAIARKMFSWGIERDILEVSPFDHVSRPAPENRRDRVLSEKELRRVWKAVEPATAAEPARLALAIILATAQRSGEVTGAGWKEIDLGGKEWTIPAERSKNGLPHTLPLSRLALRLFGRARMSGEGSAWVFPSQREEGGPLDRHAARLWVRRHLEKLDVEPFGPHDLRRTAATYMTGAGIPRLTVAKILNHAESGVTAVYDRHSYIPEMRVALEKWAGELEAIAKKKEARA